MCGVDGFGWKRREKEGGCTVHVNADDACTQFGTIGNLNSTGAEFWVQTVTERYMWGSSGSFVFPLMLLLSMFYCTAVVIPCGSIGDVVDISIRSFWALQPLAAHCALALMLF